MAVGLGNKNRPPPIPFLPGYPATNGGANVMDGGAASSLPIQELDVPSPVSGTSPSSPCYMLPLPPASSAASSPTSHLGSPVMTTSVNLVSMSDATYACAAAAEGRRPSMTPSLGAAGGGGGGGGGINDPNTGQYHHFSQPGPSNADQPSTPLLSRYDPYHGVSCYVHHPFSQRPLSGDEVKDSLQKALVYGASQFSWKLNYQDFSPRLEGLDNGSLRAGETFRDLVERANKWLEQNPQYSVRTCETVTWWTTQAVHVGDTEAVILEQSATSHAQDETIFLTGLRLWIVTREQETQTQRIAMREFHPTEQDTISDLVNRVNRQLEESPCQGSIISIETVPKADINTREEDVTLWTASQCKQNVSTHFLRLYYAEGPTKHEAIGFRDFCPDIDEVEGSDVFATLMKNAKRWLNDQRANRLINFQSLFITRKKDVPLSECANCTSHQYCKFDAHHYVNALRVFYARCPRPREMGKSPIINYVTFTPVQLLPGESTEVSYEKMRQTMLRISAWIKASGANVICCESIMTPLYPHLPTQTLPEITYWAPVAKETIVTSDNLKKYIIHIRIYLEGEYREPDPSVLPALPASLTAAIQATFLERERRHYRRKRKRRKRRRSIMIFLSAIILTVIICIIVVDQSLNFFGL